LAESICTADFIEFPKLEEDGVVDDRDRIRLRSMLAEISDVGRSLL